ncbi:MAG: orotidine-5'-phosphate decarboxylase [Clostridiales bacterium]|nr:orotidine-5'-phosphate decarboxylase [Clostridiales bacterium]
MFKKLTEEIKKKNCPICVGLDTRLEYLPEGFIKQFDIVNVQGVCEAIYEYNKQLIDELCSIIPSVKIQNAYYEMYGIEGIKTYKKTIDYARQKGLVVIVDVKRGDIGSTSSAYALAHLGKTPLLETHVPFGADIMTVNPYFGTDGVQPFIDVCKDENKGLFVLVKTSNPSSCEIQDLVLKSGKYVYENVADLVIKWGLDTIDKDCGYNAIGAVVGATHKSEGIKLRKLMKNTFFLVPGYGAQGATADDVAGMFDSMGGGAIVNSSRAILCAWKKSPELTFTEAAKKEVLLMRDSVNKAKNI